MLNDSFYWIDADVVFDDKCPDNFFEDNIKEDALISYMKRKDYHPCTSLVGFNADHKDIGKFRQEYLNIYLNDEVFNIPEWHDAFVFNWIAMNYPHYDLCNHIEDKDKGFASNVFNLVCKDWAHHNKGNLKYNER